MILRSMQEIGCSELCCVQIFDRFVPCLKDVNGKVTMIALGVLGDILPCVGPHMTNVVSLTVSAVAANLASANREIHDMALQALDQLIQLVGMFSVFILPSSSTYLNITFSALTLLVRHGC